jgi:hypothetical protein
VDPALEDGASVLNTAIITDSGGGSFERVATATASVPPFVEVTYPADGQVDVPLAASLVVTFSEPMATGSLAYTVVPDPGGWVESWSAGDTVLTLTPAAWDYAQAYSATILAEDTEGEALVPGPVPNPWTFSTVGTPPHVVATGPADGETGVPVTASLVITFSEPMITSTLAYTVTPDPGDWAESWSDGDTVVTLGHADLAHSTVYTVTVDAADTDGMPLVPGPVPNPWSFVTESGVLFRLYLPVLLRNGQ